VYEPCIVWTGEAFRCNNNNVWVVVLFCFANGVGFFVLKVVARGCPNQSSPARGGKKHTDPFWLCSTMSELGLWAIVQRGTDKNLKGSCVIAE
jgi:hypothetical protein